MTHLSQRERELYTRVFLEVDNNGDGYLNEQELKHLCAVLGYRLTDTKFKALFVGLDKDKNKKITLDEFLATMPNVEPKERNCAYLRRVFLALDKNKDGFLTVDELKGAIKRDGATIHVEELQALLFQVDHNEDGKINYEEFLEMALSCM